MDGGESPEDGWESLTGPGARQLCRGSRRWSHGGLLAWSARAPSKNVGTLMAFVERGQT